MKVNSYIEHTVLAPFASSKELIRYCEEAQKHHFHAVCVNGSHVSLIKEQLKESDVAICSVIGFPLGSTHPKVKVFEAEQAVSEGADEIDMVLNIGKLKDRDTHAVLQEISFVKNAIGNHLLKVIIETCYLTREEKEMACLLSADAGADFVKTSTGFGSGGAKLEDVQLMHRILEGRLKIKASGGIKDYQTALSFIENGASRIGTSNGVAIVSGHSGEGTY